MNASVCITIALLGDAALWRLYFVLMLMVWIGAGTVFVVALAGWILRSLIRFAVRQLWRSAVR
jgi:hypothetical protein